MPLASPELRIWERRFEQSVGIAFNRTTNMVEVKVREQNIRDVSP